MEDATVADRLTLVSQVGAKFLSEPVWIKAGERYWYDEATSSFVVEDQRGRARSFPCAYQTGPDAIR